MKNLVTPTHVLAGICVIAAAAVAMTGHDGWGWFLAAAFFLIA